MCNSKPLNIRLNKISLDERVAYVESVCAVFNEGRFGPGRGKPIIVHLSDRPELENGVFFEMSMTGPYPAYTVLPDSEMARRYSEDIIKRELAQCDLSRAELELILANDPNLSPSNLARGSP